jgi:hypothetical protein
MPKGDIDPQTTENLDIMKVFDIEVKQWRSFRLANLIYIKTNHTS